MVGLDIVTVYGPAVISNYWIYPDRDTKGCVKMRLNTKCSIALHCLIFMAEYKDRVRVTSGLLAKSTGCNPVIIRNIMAALQKEKVITVARGVGGARLAAAPEELTLWQVFGAVEPGGLEHLIGMHPAPSEQCPVGRRISDVLAKPYGEIGAAVRERMEKITLRQLLDDYRNGYEEGIGK